MMTSQTQEQELDWRNVTFNTEKQKLFNEILLALIILFTGIWIGSRLFADEPGYGTNIYTELLSIGVTILILDRLAKYRATNQLKKQLVWDVASRSNEMAKRAVTIMRHEKWLTGPKGILRGKDLYGAQLQESDLGGANLSETILVGANLSGANLQSINLSKAQVIGANLQNSSMALVNLSGADLLLSDMSGATLWSANLRGANLGINLQNAKVIGANPAYRNTNLSNAQLIGSSLFGAILWGANFAGANLENVDLENAVLKGENPMTQENEFVQFSPDTVLPDGTKWGNNKDIEYMRRFTDPTHSDFKRYKTYWDDNDTSPM